MFRKKDQPQMIVRPAHYLDLDEICEAAVEFFHESSFRKLRLRVDKYRKLVENHLDHPYCKSLICRIDGELAGYIHVYCQDDYTEELIGELYQFYVRKPYRASGVARALVQAADIQWRVWGCARAYSDANPGFDDGGQSVKLFKNLWGKFGFNSTGQSFMKEFV